MIAILRLASLDKACAPPSFVRPQGYDQHPPVAAPDDDSWYPVVMRELNPDARAIVAILTVHGRRISELLKRHPRDLDVNRGTLFLGRTKNGDEILLRLEPHCYELILQMADWEQREYLFRYQPISGVNAVNQALQDACVRAGVSYYSSHKLGRHRFAQRLLDKGYLLQHVKDAGGWSTLKVLSDRYGSRAMSEHTETVHSVGGEVMRLVNSGERVGEAFGELPQGDSEIA